MPLPDWFWEDDDVVLVPFDFNSTILDALNTPEGRRKLAASMMGPIRHKAKISNFGMLYGGEPISHFVPRTNTGRTPSTPEIHTLTVPKERQYVPGKATGTFKIDYAKIEMDEIKRLLDMGYVTPEQVKEMLADAPVR